MRRLLIAFLTAMPLAALVPAIHPAGAAVPPSVKCSGVTLTLHPGYHPPLPNGHPSSVPGDAPRAQVTVSLPTYPGVVPLEKNVGSPFPQGSVDPYLQTASIEYRLSPVPTGVEEWITGAFHACGWSSRGSWSGNTSPFSDGLGFVSKGNGRLTADVSFGSAPSGGLYIAYAVEEPLYPPRPSRSYLHGPFTRVTITVLRQKPVPGTLVSYKVHTTVLNRGSIHDLVAAVNGVNAYIGNHGVVCPGPLRLVGPAWLTFTRPNGTASHAFEWFPGICGGLAVNGVRWLIDDGRVWKRILALSGGKG